jgi:membrane protein YqaA with SNARE-associated domain
MKRGPPGLTEPPKRPIGNMTLTSRMDREKAGTEEVSPKRAILIALLLISLAFALALAGQVFLKGPLTDLAGSIVGSMGYPGIFISIFVLDLLILPLSPDVILFLSVVSEADPTIYMPLICTASILAGSTAYVLGRFLGRQRVVKAMLGRNERKWRPVVRRYGMLAVVLSALTPIPYSTICLLAGMMKMDYRQFLVGTLWRVPKFLVWYLLIGLGFKGTGL